MKFTFCIKLLNWNFSEQKVCYETNYDSRAWSIPALFITQQTNLMFGAILQTMMYVILQLSFCHLKKQRDTSHLSESNIIAPLVLKTVGNFSLWSFKVCTTEHYRGRIFNTVMVLLVLICELHFWVSSLLYSLDICCLPFFTRCYVKMGHQGKIRQNIVFYLNCLAYYNWLWFRWYCQFYPYYVLWFSQNANNQNLLKSRA